MKKPSSCAQQSGFVLVLTLMILSTIVMLVTQLFQSSVIHFYFDRTMIEREKAKMLARGGIELAYSLLTVIPPKDKEGAKAGYPPQEGQEKKDLNVELLKKILPTLNRWQTFELTDNADGIDGEIKLCITCEDGKLDLNQWYDFNKKKFIGEGANQLDGKKILKAVFGGLKKTASGKDLFEQFEKFLKQRQYKLNDVTELLTVKELREALKDAIFYEPPSAKTGKKEQRPVYLMDIFTLWSDKKTLNPWLLSDSICAIVGLKRAEQGDTATHEKEVDQLLKSTKSVEGDIKVTWEKVLQKLYGKELKAIPNDFSALFAQKFEARTFGVLSYGRVGSITQKMYAIIGREKDALAPYTIKRLYWL